MRALDSMYVQRVPLTPRKPLAAVGIKREPGEAEMAASAASACLLVRSHDRLCPSQLWRPVQLVFRLGSCLSADVDYTPTSGFVPTFYCATRLPHSVLGVPPA